MTDHCSSPPELSEHQLLAHLDGERKPEIIAHLEECPYCRERSRKLAQMQNYLATQLYRITCPTSLELGDYVLGLLPARQSGRISAHVGDCPHCSKEVIQLKEYLQDLSPASRFNPLESARVLIARVISGIEPGEQTGRLFGTPVLAPAYATVRGGSQGPLTLQADGILIILDVQPAVEGRLALIGQVVSEEQDLWNGAKVQLFRDDELLAFDKLSDIGGFHCDAIAPGMVEIKITPVSGPVVLASLEIVA